MRTLSYSQVGYVRAAVKHFSYMQAWKEVRRSQLNSWLELLTPFDFPRWPWEKSSNFSALQFLTYNKTALPTPWENFEDKTIKNCGHYRTTVPKDTSAQENFCFPYVRIKKKQINQVKMLTFYIYLHPIWDRCGSVIRLTYYLSTEPYDAVEPVGVRITP